MQEFNSSAHLKQTTKSGKQCLKLLEEESIIYPTASRFDLKTYGSGLFVQPSTISGAGLGVFTSVKIPKDNSVCAYVGELLFADQRVRIISFYEPILKTCSFIAQSNTICV